MRQSKLNRLWPAAVLALGCVFAGQVHALAEVRFLEPEKFSDAGETDRERDANLKILAEHLQAQVEKFAPGQQVQFEVTDVDLAGQMEPYGRRMERLRVLRGITSPKIDFRFTVSEGGQALRQGEVHLRDLAYQSRTLGRYFDSEPLRYEKQMLDDWFRAEFSKDKRTAH